MSLVLINAVGLTPRLLPLAPRLNALAQSGWHVPLPQEGGPPPPPLPPPGPPFARGGAGGVGCPPPPHRTRRYLFRSGNDADGPTG